MKSIIIDMRNIYRLRGYDFLGYTYRNVSELSFHHITKKCDGGEMSIDNGALLNKETSHPYLHLIEFKEFDIYVAINEIIREITQQRKHPTTEQLKRIRALLLEFEALHIDDVNNKGNKIIKKQYIDRRIDL